MATFDESRWITRNYYPGCECFVNTGTCSRDRALSYSDTRPHKDVRTYPHLIMQVDVGHGQGQLRVFVVVGGRAQVTVLGHHAVFADAHGCHIITDHVVGHTAMIAHVQVPGGPDLAGRIYMDASAHACAKGPQEGPAPGKAEPGTRSEQQEPHPRPEYTHYPIPPGMRAGAVT